MERANKNTQHNAVSNAGAQTGRAISGHSAQQLERLFGQQLTQLQNMLGILKQEHKALESNNIEAFEKAVQKKQNQAQVLESIEPQLSAITKSIDGKLSKSSVETYIDQIATGAIREKTQDVWKQLQTIVTQCNEQNQINNRILHASRTNLQQVLSILRGNTEPPQTQVYGSSGKQDLNTHGQSLAVA